MRKERYPMILNKPPMGWNSWNTFAEDISEQLIFDTADAMVKDGLLDCGYEYLVIDDCWQSKTRDANGRLVPDPKKFPHGMKYVVDYVHSKGLKFGLYSCVGALTCAEYPGSYQHEYTDAATFAEWGVDYLKYDYCFRDVKVVPERHYRKMGLALANCGRDIVFSACNWGFDNVQNWIKTTGAHLWRSTPDMFDTWGSLKKITESQLELLPYNYRGCFNDMDMLVVGMNGRGFVANEESTLSFEEYKLHFSIWALFGSPLMLGCDVRNMTEETKRIITNKELIAISQDAACNQPIIVKHSYSQFEIFFACRLLENGDIAIGIFNMSDEVGNKAGAWMLPNDLGLTPESGMTLHFRDLWDGSEKELENDIIMEAGLPPHSCRVYRASVVKKK